MLGVIFLLTLLWLLYKIVKILLSDADLTLSSCSLRRKYFQDKIILVTGASGGSEHYWDALYIYELSTFPFLIKGLELWMYQ